MIHLPCACLAAAKLLRIGWRLLLPTALLLRIFRFKHLLKLASFDEAVMSKNALLEALCGHSEMSSAAWAQDRLLC